MKTRAEIIQRLIELRRERQGADHLPTEINIKGQMEILKWVLDEQL